MTDTLTDRERALVEAAKEIASVWQQLGGEQYYTFMQKRLVSALRAYDPPKVKRYCMPEWEDFARGRQTIGGSTPGVFVRNEKTGCEIPVFQSSYELAREALATEE